MSSSYGSSLALVGTSDETEPLLTRLHASGQNHLQAHLRIYLNSRILQSKYLLILFHSYLSSRWIGFVNNTKKTASYSTTEVETFGHLNICFRELGHCYFSYVDNSFFENLYWVSIPNSYSNWDFVRCSKRSSMLPSNLRDMDPSPKLRRNSYSGNFNSNW